MQVSTVEKANLLSHVVALDPFCEIDKAEVNALIAEKEEVENYVYELHKPGEVTKEEADRRLNNLKDYKNFLEDIKTELGERVQNSTNLSIEEQHKAEMLKFNYEVIVYLRQG
jgi:hypothetical protein